MSTFFFQKIDQKHQLLEKIPLGCSSRFRRANKLILTKNETSIHLHDFECNRTSNQDAKYELNFKSDVQCHRLPPAQAPAISPSVSMENRR